MRRSLLVALGLILIVGAGFCEAQRGKSIGHKPSPVRQISGQEAGEFLEKFRSQRLASDYSFKFKLIQLPRHGHQQVYAGTMWGIWNSQGPVTRLELYSISKPAQKLDLLVQGGADARFWVLERGSYRELTAKEAYEPLMGDLLYSPYELFMNFIYWRGYRYEGSERIRSRPAHFFLMEPPSEVQVALPDLKGVRMAIDSGYKAPIRAEVINANGGVKRVFQVLNFKKVAEEWLVKDIDLVDNNTRDRARFEIEGAAIGLNLDAKYFKPENMAQGVPPIENKRYRLL